MFQITINYAYSMVAMKKIKERKQKLANVFGVFNCLCELCQYEKTSNVEDKSYELFEKLQEILKNFFNQGLFTVRSAQNGCTGIQIAISRCIAISACIQMYNLAKMKNCHKQFLLTDIIKHVRRNFLKLGLHILRSNIFIFHKQQKIREIEIY